MRDDSKNKKAVKVKFFSTEYNEIVNSYQKSVIIETQWSKEGDFFQKLSMYDNSYIPVETLGSTTLI